MSVNRGQFDKQACDVIVDTGDGWRSPASGSRTRPTLPSRPLVRAGGTRYFSENGLIGCR